MAAAAATTAMALRRGGASRAGAAGFGLTSLYLRTTSPQPPEVDELVSVLIAVRHEPDPTVAAVHAALAQHGVSHLDIVVLDDGCPQETRTALRQEFGDDPRVRILAAAPLPRGWSPRAHRSHQLAVAARGRVLIFAEPNAPLGPHAAASVTALLRNAQLDLAVLDTGRSRPAPPPERDSQAPSTGNGAAASTDVGTASGTRADNSARASNVRSSNGRFQPGRFTVAVDAETYWRTGGYRKAAGDPDPLSLLRTVRRANGRVAVADGRGIIPPAVPLAPYPAADPQSAADAEWDSMHASRVSLGETARRVFAALVGGNGRSA